MALKKCGRICQSSRWDNMKILLIVAMQSELDSFLKHFNGEIILIHGIKVYKKIENAKEIYLAKTEVGKVNAACLTTALCLKIKPQYIINAGIGGGLTPSISLLDVVASSKIAYHDFDLTAFGYQKGEMDNHQLYFKASTKLLNLLSDNVKKGLIVSGDQFVGEKQALNFIKKDFPKALICDMEGCAIAHVATLLSRKFLIIRAVSDNVFLENQVSVYQDNKTLAIEKVVQIVYDLIDKL